MRDWSALRDRFMRDNLSVRLGGIAANLARIRSFSDHPEHRYVVETLLDESKFFIEWTAPSAGIELQVELVELQLQLARWHRSWADIWADQVQRKAVAEQAHYWSKRVLEMSDI